MREGETATIDVAETRESVELELRRMDEGVLDLLQAWDGLVEAGNGSLFETPLWVLNYWRHRFSQRSLLTFVVARARSGEIVGLVPLVARAQFGVRLVQRAVHATGEYPSDWLCRPAYADAFAAAICDELLGRRSGRARLTLAVVSETSPMLRSMVAECRRRDLYHQLRRARRIPFLETTSDSPSSVPLRGKYRRELSRRRRSLEQLGPLGFETWMDEESLALPFAEFVRVERASWKGREGTAIGSDARTRAFWWELAREAAALGCLRLDLMRLGGEVISGQLGILSGRCYYCLKLGYDERYSRFGPGALLTQRVIERCVEEPAIDVYDFAGTAQPYMWNWTDQSYETWTLAVSSPSRWG